MLKEISAGKVGEIAGLAKETRVARDRFLNKAQLGRDDAGGAEGPGKPRGPGGAIHDELGNPEMLEGTADNGAVEALKHDVDALTPAQRRELLAVMFIGRGEFAANEWDAAMRQADGIPEASLTRYATDESLLHDYLEKGLYELGAAA